MNIKKKNHLELFLKSFKSMLSLLPLMISVILLIALVKEFITFKVISSFFQNNIMIDTLIGALSGSILAGNSLNSYVIGGELLTGGVSLFAVTAFIVTWVTVGFVQAPAEAAILGTKFTIWRNVLSFVLSMLVSVLTVFVLGLV